MKRVVIFLLFISCIYCKSTAQPVKYVVLISIDGLRPDFYLDDNWATPNLHELVKSGMYSDGINSVYPSLTYPAHTTIVTGALPAKHGIYSNERFGPGEVPARWYWEASLIKTPTLWDAIHKAGLTCAAISWPVTSGAPIDHNVPEIWSLDKKIDKVTPIREATTPKGFFEEIEQYATGRLTDNDVDNAFLSMDENTGRIASYTIKKYKPNLIAIHFVCADHFQHTEGRNGPMVKKAVAAIDREIEKITEALTVAGIKDSTAIIVTGDHGFCDIHTSLAPNVWLAQNGLIRKINGKPEWTAWFHTSGPFALLHLKHREDVSVGKQVRQILNDLPESQRKMFRIIGRSELDKMGADPDAVLALDPLPGITMNNAFDGPEIKTVHGGAHGYFPDFKQIQTGFIAYGTAFNKGELPNPMGIEDVSPIIATLLHLDFKSPDGKLPDGLLIHK